MDMVIQDDAKLQEKNAGDSLVYGIEDVPPWPSCIGLAVQVGCTQLKLEDISAKRWNDPKYRITDCAWRYKFRVAITGTL